MPVQITRELSNDEIWECFEEILLLPDAELRAKVAERITDLTSEIGFMREIDKATDLVPPGYSSSEEFRAFFDKRRTTLLARLTLLLENI